tara:strand:- start:372 stop:722 length:351 start_codon:yes stop_codon:yes gene_type:complete
VKTLAYTDEQRDRGKVSEKAPPHKRNATSVSTTSEGLANRTLNRCSENGHKAQFKTKNGRWIVRHKMNLAERGHVILSHALAISTPTNLYSSYYLSRCEHIYGTDKNIQQQTSKLA